MVYLESKLTYYLERNCTKPLVASSVPQTLPVQIRKICTTCSHASHLLLNEQVCANVEVGETPYIKPIGEPQATTFWCWSMVGSTRQISHTNPMDFLRRTPQFGHSWCARTFLSIEVCQHAMALCRDCLRIWGQIATREGISVGNMMRRLGDLRQVVQFRIIYRKALPRSLRDRKHPKKYNSLRFSILKQLPFSKVIRRGLL